MKLNHAARERCRELRRSQTNAEKIFWDHVRNRKLVGLKFYRQYPIFYENNCHESFFIVDFFCFKKNTVIEIDGKIHDFKKKEDDARSLVLADLGLRVIRIKNEDIENNIKQVIKKLTLLLEVKD